MGDIVEVVMAGAIRSHWMQSAAGDRFAIRAFSCTEMARDVLAALEGAGYAVVPVVPTEAMDRAAANALGDHMVEGWTFLGGVAWSAMLAAYKHPAADTAGPTRPEGQE